MFAIDDDALILPERRVRPFDVVEYFARRVRAHVVTIASAVGERVVPNNDESVIAVLGDERIPLALVLHCAMRIVVKHVIDALEGPIAFGTFLEDLDSRLHLRHAGWVGACETITFAVSVSVRVRVTLTWASVGSDFILFESPAASTRSRPRIWDGAKPALANKSTDTRNSGMMPSSRSGALVSCVIGMHECSPICVRDMEGRDRHARDGYG